MIYSIVAALLLLLAVPASAQTGAVTTDADGAFYLALPIPADPGRYRLDFSFSQPGTGLLEIHSEQSYNFYDVDTGDYYGGDDVPTYRPFEFPTPVTSGWAAWTILPPYTAYYGNIREAGSYRGVDALFSFRFATGATIDYAVTVTAVPETAIWVLLVLGLGGAGAAMRRRTASQAPLSSL
ncbi:MAG: hypothetical protein ABW023_03060 [Sphingomonas sp.]